MTIIDKTKFGPWAVVTGASSGIGKEFARQLAASGLNVVLVARRFLSLEQIGRELAQEFGVQYRAVKLDLTEENFVDTIEEATLDLDVGIVISNAGTGNPGNFLQIERSKLLHIVQLNVVAHLGMAHHFGRRLATRGRGGLLLVGAMGAAQGIPYMANDGATKAYVQSLGESLHSEFQTLGLNVTVLLPGPTNTAVLAKFGFNAETMPMKPMSVERCVSEGLAALNVNRATHIAGRVNRIMNAIVPHALARKLMGRMLLRALATKGI